MKVNDKCHLYGGKGKKKHKEIVKLVKEKPMTYFDYLRKSDYSSITKQLAKKAFNQR